MLGYQLVTVQKTTPTIDERQAMDQRVLALVKAIEPGLANGEAKSALATIARRLEGFVGPSGSANP